MEALEMKKQLDELKSGLESNLNEKTKETVQKAVNDLQSALESKNTELIQKAIKENLSTVNEGLKELAAWKGERTEADKKNQDALDSLISQIKNINKSNTKEVKSFSQAFAEELPNHFDHIMKVKKGSPYRMELKAVGDMTTTANLTGDSVATYSSRQAIVPAQKINIRDLIPSVHSDTGLYVQYRETGGEGALAVQTEGADKGQVDYDFTEVKVVNDYIAGIARFSKQMARSLPWMTQTLPRLLLRDFYKKENSTFFAAVAGAATGSTTTAETDDVKTLIDLLANQMQADFNASFGLVSHTQMARLNKLLYSNGWNQPGGGVVSLPNGSLSIGGIPIVPASWVTDDKVLIIDNDFLERVEVESIVVEFFEQDYKNVQQNKITARIECYEDINLMLTQSAIYADFGNAS